MKKRKIRHAEYFHTNTANASVLLALATTKITSKRSVLIIVAPLQSHNHKVFLFTGCFQQQPTRALGMTSKQNQVLEAN